MMKKITTISLFLLSVSCMLFARGTIDDYKRAFALPEKYKNAVPNARITPRWIDDNRFWYIRETADGEEYVVVDALEKRKTITP